MTKLLFWRLQAPHIQMFRTATGPQINPKLVAACRNQAALPDGRRPNSASRQARYTGEVVETARELHPSPAPRPRSPTRNRTLMTLELPPGPFKAYLFDCDGTIVDSMPLHYVAWNRTLAEW